MRQIKELHIKIAEKDAEITELKGKIAGICPIVREKEPQKTNFSPKIDYPKSAHKRLNNSYRDLNLFSQKSINNDDARSVHSFKSSKSRNSRKN